MLLTLQQELYIYIYKQEMDIEVSEIRKVAQDALSFLKVLLVLCYRFPYL
jgi:hypothetical protein